MAIDIIGELAEDDELNGGDGRDNIIGLSGDDTLNGRGGKDLLNGGEDNDKLKGGADNDILEGDSGKDVLDGGNGADRLKGGDDEEIFKFGKDFGNDRIVDFEDKDTINLSTLHYNDFKFGDLKIKYDDGDAIIVNSPDGKIVIENVAKYSLTKSDFDF